MLQVLSGWIKPQITLHRGLKVHVTWHLFKANLVFHKGAVTKTRVVIYLKLFLFSYSAKSLWKFSL